MFRASDGSDSPWAKRAGKVEFVVASAGLTARYDGIERPGQSGGDEESSQWLNERLTACYND